MIACVDGMSKALMYSVDQSESSMTKTEQLLPWDGHIPLHY